MSSPLDWCADYGAVTLLAGGPGNLRRAILRVLAGLERPQMGLIKWDAGLEGSKSDVRTAPSRAWLPPPGEEIFAGTTVEEELQYPAVAGKGEVSPTEIFSVVSGLDFSRLLKRSVWELSAGERRLLLLTAQAAWKPSIWVCCEPLACLDGAWGRAVLNFLDRQRKRRAAVIITSSDPGPLLALSDRVVILTEGAGVHAVFGRKELESMAVDLDAIGNPALRLIAERVGQGEKFGKLMAELDLNLSLAPVKPEPRLE